MPPPTKSDLPQGTLDLLILKVIALGPIHGYAIAQRIQQISREVLQVQQGSLYPALHRLENKGFLAADWKETETGREAKYYRLTAKGRSHLNAETANWKRLASSRANSARLRCFAWRSTRTMRRPVLASSNTLMSRMCGYPAGRARATTCRPGAPRSAVC